MTCLSTIARGRKKLHNNLVSEPPDSEMVDNTRSAQLEERMRNLQASHAALQETSEQHGALLAEVLQRLNEMRDSQKEQEGSSGHSRGPAPFFGNNGGIHTRSMKLEFPRFNGKHLSGWLFKAKQYFAYHQVPEAQWLIVASLNIEGDALEWYQWSIDYQC